MPLKIPVLTEKQFTELTDRLAALDTELQAARESRARLVRLARQRSEIAGDWMLSAVALQGKAERLQRQLDIEHGLKEIHKNLEREAASRANALKAENKKLRAALESPELVEKLAAVAHESWSGWMNYLFDKVELATNQHGVGVVAIPPDLEFRWKRQMNTLYADLPEKEKPSDRDEARKYLEAVRAALNGEGK